MSQRLQNEGLGEEKGWARFFIRCITSVSQWIPTQWVTTSERKHPLQASFYKQPPPTLTSLFSASSIDDNEGDWKRAYQEQAGERYTFSDVKPSVSSAPFVMSSSRSSSTQEWTWEGEIFNTWNPLRWSVRTLYFGGPTKFGFWGGMPYSKVCSELSNDQLDPAFWNKEKNGVECIHNVLLPQVRSLETVVMLVVSFYLCYRLFNIIVNLCLHKSRNLSRRERHSGYYDNVWGEEDLSMLQHSHHQRQQEPPWWAYPSYSNRYYPPHKSNSGFSCPCDNDFSSYADAYRRIPNMLDPVQHTSHLQKWWEDAFRYFYEKMELSKKASDERGFPHKTSQRRTKQHRKSKQRYYPYSSFDHDHAPPEHNSRRRRVSLGHNRHLPPEDHPTPLRQNNDLEINNPRRDTDVPPPAPSPPPPPRHVHFRSDPTTGNRSGRYKHGTHEQDIQEEEEGEENENQTDEQNDQVSVDNGRSQHIPGKGHRRIVCIQNEWK